MVFMVVIFFSCSSEHEELPESVEVIKKPTEISINTTILYSDSAILKLKLVTPELQRWDKEEEPYVEFPKGLEVFFYDSLGNLESSLKANYGINYTKQKRVEVRHDVEVLNGKHEKLNTEELTWLEEEERIFTEKFVKITTPDEIITGDGLESNQTFTKYKIKNIKGTFSVEDDEEELEE